MSFLFQIILRPEPEGGSTVIVPSLPGCVSYGETLDEAKTMAHEAIALYVEAIRSRNGTIVDDTNILETRLEVTVP